MKFGFVALICLSQVCFTTGAKADGCKSLPVYNCEKEAAAAAKAEFLGAQKSFCNYDTDESLAYDVENFYCSTRIKVPVNYIDNKCYIGTPVLVPGTTECP